MATPPTALEDTVERFSYENRDFDMPDPSSNPHIHSGENWLNRDDKIDEKEIIFGTPQNPSVTRKTKNIIEGPEKSFKTTYLLPLCIGLSTSQTVYPRLPVLRSHTVLYLHGELGDWQIKDRTMWAQQEHDLQRPLDNFFQGRDTKMHLVNTLGQKLIRNALQEFSPLDIVVFDPLQQFITGCDESAYKEMSVATAFMDDLIEEFGVTVFLVGHTGKDKTAGVRGTSLFAGWRDTLFRLKRDGDTNRLTVEVKPRWGSADFNFSLQFENNTMQPVDREFTDQTRLIQEVVREAGGECLIETIIDFLVFDEKKKNGKTKKREACLKAIKRAEGAGAICLLGKMALLPPLQTFRSPDTTTPL